MTEEKQRMVYQVTERMNVFLEELSDTFPRDKICSLSKETIKSITGRDWVLSCF